MRHGIAVVMLMFLEKTSERRFIALLRVPDLHGGSSNIAGPPRQSTPKSTPWEKMHERRGQYRRLAQACEEAAAQDRLRLHRRRHRRRGGPGHQRTGLS